MNAFTAAQQIANRTARHFNAVANGVAIHVVPGRDGLNYVIVNETSRHVLSVGHTCEARLGAHLQGFIQNQGA